MQFFRGWVARLLGMAVMVMLVMALHGGVAVAQDSGQPGVGITIDDLRQGGYVIFFRHGMADQGLDQALLDVDDCTTQRNLSVVGLEQSRTIGQAFRTQRIPVGVVLTSEFCRAIETAYIAFHHGTPMAALNLCCSDQRPFTNEERQQFMLRTIAIPPADGTNTVIVAHGVFDQADLAMGEASINLPDGNGGYQRVARVLPAEWQSGVYWLNPVR